MEIKPEKQQQQQKKRLSYSMWLNINKEFDWWLHRNGDQNIYRHLKIID